MQIGGKLCVGSTNTHLFSDQIRPLLDMSMAEDTPSPPPVSRDLSLRFRKSIADCVNIY